MQFPSDQELASYLSACEADHLYLVVVAVHSKVSPDSWKYFRSYVDGKEPIPEPGSSERDVVVAAVLEQMRYFGSHSIAYGLRRISPFHKEPGVSYAELLRDAEKTIFDKFSPRSKPAKINSVAGRERQIATLLLSKTIAEIPDDELLTMLGESGLETDACKKTLAELRDPTLGAVAILGAGKLLGKKKTRDLMLALLTGILTKYAQKEGAKQVAVQLAKKFPQKAFLRFSIYVGWTLLAWDAYQLAGPAKRVTVPVVAAIAILRTAHRLRAASDT